MAAENPIKNHWLNDDTESVSDYQKAAEGLSLFFSRQSLSADALGALFDFAKEKKVKEGICSLFSANSDTSVSNSGVYSSHVLMRQSFFSEQASKSHEWALFFSWLKALSSSRLPIENSPEIKDVIHLGIGGSFLGPDFLKQAIPAKNNNIKLHFLPCSDEDTFNHTIQACDPRHTLVIAVSKSFKTQETIDNLELLKRWMGAVLSDDEIALRLLAITANSAEAMRYNILETHIIPLRKDLSGRFSVCSPVSLSVAALIGCEAFTEFMRGAFNMDQHAKMEDYANNLPIISACLEYRNVSELGIPTVVVLPYSRKLAGFVPYLQQLSMESLGKPLPIDSDTEKHACTGPIVWGAVGPDFQHSFQQLIMQGTHRISAEFIITKNSTRSQWQNAFAQAQLMQTGNGLTGPACIPGGHPSTTWCLDSLSPKNLGTLISAYEHKIQVQSILCGINCFDQPGVESGKVLSKSLSIRQDDQLDATTRLLSAHLES